MTAASGGASGASQAQARAAAELWVARPSSLVETAIEQHYATAGLSDTEREQVRRAIAEDLGERMTTARQEVERCQGVLDEVKEQERKLLHMRYEDRITGELFDEEQKRIKRERRAAETLIERLNLGYQGIETTLDLALEIIGEDLHTLYQRADDTIRRLLNQAIFMALYFSDEEITRTELAEPFAQLTRPPQRCRRRNSQKAARRRQKNDQRPRPDRGQEPLDVGSISGVMVEPTGIEPVTSCLQSRRSPS
jgi:hypothetical protein